MHITKSEIQCPSGTLVVIDSQEFYNLLEKIGRDEILPPQMMEKLKKLSLEKSREPGSIKTISLDGHNSWNATIQSDSAEPKITREFVVTTKK